MYNCIIDTTTNNFTCFKKELKSKYTFLVVCCTLNEFKPPHCYILLFRIYML